MYTRGNIGVVKTCVCHTKISGEYNCKRYLKLSFIYSDLFCLQLVKERCASFYTYIQIRYKNRQHIVKRKRRKGIALLRFPLLCIYTHLWYAHLKCMCANKCRVLSLHLVAGPNCSKGVWSHQMFTEQLASNAEVLILNLWVRLRQKAIILHMWKGGRRHQPKTTSR